MDSGRGLFAIVGLKFKEIGGEGGGFFFSDRGANLLEFPVYVD